MEKKTGLVLEGGAMRGIFTAGVLDFFMKRDLYFPYVIGVSAGALQACSYVSGQFGRSKEVTMKLIRDPRYISLRNLIREGGMFGLDFMFDEVTKKIIPFDFDTFLRSEQEFAVGVTDCETGRIRFFYKSQMGIEDFFTVCKASSSMPLVSKKVCFQGRCYLDGGISDSIPLGRAISDGYEKNVVVLTRNKGYRKKPSKGSMKIARVEYRRYPHLLEAMENRHRLYNETLDRIEALEEEGKVFVIRPTLAVRVGRMERDKRKLFEFYKEGYRDARRRYSDLKNWLEK